MDLRRGSWRGGERRRAVGAMASTIPSAAVGPPTTLLAAAPARRSRTGSPALHGQSHRTDTLDAACPGYVAAGNQPGDLGSIKISDTMRSFNLDE